MRSPLPEPHEALVSPSSGADNSTKGSRTTLPLSRADNAPGAPKPGARPVSRDPHCCMTPPGGTTPNAPPGGEHNLVSRPPVRAGKTDLLSLRREQF